MNTEPVATITTIVTAVGAFLASLVKMAVLLQLVQWTPEQVAGISLVVDNFLAVVTLVLIVIFVRDRVTPTASPILPVGTVVNDNLRTNDPPAVVTAPGEVAPSISTP